MAEKEKELEQFSLRMDAFCVHFTTLGADTYSRGKASAEASGYAEASAGNRATKLLKRPDVRSRIAELHRENCERNFLTVDKILSDLENLRILSEEKKDYATAARCLEIVGKYFAMWVDRTIVDTPQHQRELSEKEKEQAEAIAKILLQQSKSPLSEGGKEEALEIAKAQQGLKDKENTNG